MGKNNHYYQLKLNLGLPYTLPPACKLYILPPLFFIVPTYMEKDLNI